MRLRYLLWMLIICSGLNAQITLDIDDAPVAGDTLLYVSDTLVADVSVGMPGPDQTWDFSDLGITEISQITYIAPEDAPNNDAFPAANLVQGIDQIFNFIEVNTNGIFALGASLDFFGNGEMLVVPFQPPQTIFLFPGAYGDSFQDTTTFVVQIEDPVFGADSIRATQVLIQDVTYDAYGTVTTPGGTFETLRREVVTETSTTIEALFLGNWVEIQNTNTISTSYEWIAEDGRTQVLIIDLDETGAVVETTYQVDEVPMGMLPEASFLATSNDASTFNFMDQSTNDPTSWIWDFGDGTASDLQNPMHTYTEAGFYTVCLIANNFFGADTVCQQVEVIFPPVAAFSFMEDSPGKFIFTDESTSDPETWFWDFGDGFTISEQNPTHTFNMIGTFTVCLTVGNPAGANTLCQDLEVILAPEASFSFEDQGGGTFKFSDFSSNNPDGWDWDFGDGSSSMEQNPFYTYTETGIYTVCLKASNIAGSSTSCKEAEVVVSSLDPLDPTARMVVVPNPASTQVELLTFNHQLNNARVRILNILGQEVFQKAATPQMSIDISTWSKGSYFYLLQDDEGRIMEKGKLQVQ